jgi:hypothetical protein
MRWLAIAMLLGCGHATPAPQVNNTARATPQIKSPLLVDRARVQLERAHALLTMGAYELAYDAAQRGINILDGDALDEGGALEVGTTQAAHDELVMMTALRIRELERRIARAPAR